MRVAVLTISDRSSRGEREDKSGPVLIELIRKKGWEVVLTSIVSDDQGLIEDILLEWSDSNSVDVILTTGGTGFAPRDRAPEATLAVVDRLTPGLAEAMRSASMGKTPHAMLSRAVAGIRGSNLIVNLPGSPKAARENLEVILPALPHAVQLLTDDPDAETGHQPPRRIENA
jgi:molybdenum cofactor synthesis domain-containing protein